MKNNVQWRRRIVLGLLAVLVAWGLFQGFRPQAVEVDMGAASRAALRVTLEQEGRTRVLDRYVVTAPRPAPAMPSWRNQNSSACARYACRGTSAPRPRTAPPARRNAA